MQIRDAAALADTEDFGTEHTSHKNARFFQHAPPRQGHLVSFYYFCIFNIFIIIDGVLRGAPFFDRYSCRLLLRSSPLWTASRMLASSDAAMLANGTEIFFRFSKAGEPASGRLTQKYSAGSDGLLRLVVTEATTTEPSALVAMLSKLRIPWIDFAAVDFHVAPESSLHRSSTGL